MSDRRTFLKLGGATVASLLVAPALAQAAKPATAPRAGRGSATALIAGAADFAALEAASGGRLGVTLMEAQGRIVAGHRQHELFPMCSTVKFPLSAAVLHLAAQGALTLEQRLPIRAEDLIDHAPTTVRHVGKDLTIRDLCRTVMVTSDNPAANLLFHAVGGPPGLTRVLRAHGDTVTRSDRLEPELNQFAQGDPRDTTSPVAMARTLQRFVLGDALPPAARQQLADWLIDNETGDATLRAGLGMRWRVGDKTGSNGTDTRNDIAVLWPQAGGAAWVLTAYLQGATVDSAARDAVLARVGALAEALIG